MSAAEFDHGPKEAAQHGVAIILDDRGEQARRTRLAEQMLKTKTNTLIIRLSERALSETLSPLMLAVRIFLLADHLADSLKIQSTYRLGGKVTAPPASVR